MGENVENKRKTAEKLGDGRKLANKASQNVKHCLFFATLPFFSPVSSHFLVLLDFPRFSSILLDSPRFSSIFLDSPRFSSILLDSPRFSSILLDSPRFSSILLDSPRFSSIVFGCCSLARATQILQHAPFFRHFPLLGAFLPHNWTFCTLLNHFPPKIAKLPFFLAKSATLHHFWPFASKTCNIGRFCTNGPFSPFFLPKVAKLPVFVPEQLFWTIRVESASFVSISIFF